MLHTENLTVILTWLSRVELLSVRLSRVGFSLSHELIFQPRTVCVAGLVLLLSHRLMSTGGRRIRSDTDSEQLDPCESRSISRSNHSMQRSKTLTYGDFDGEYDFHLHEWGFSSPTTRSSVNKRRKLYGTSSEQLVTPVAHV